MGFFSLLYCLLHCPCRSWENYFKRKQQCLHWFQAWQSLRNSILARSYSPLSLFLHFSALPPKINVNLLSSVFCFVSMSWLMFYFNNRTQWKPLLVLSMKIFVYLIPWPQLVFSFFHFFLRILSLFWLWRVASSWWGGVLSLCRTRSMSPPGAVFPAWLEHDI